VIDRLLESRQKLAAHRRRQHAVWYAGTACWAGAFVLALDGRWLWVAAVLALGAVLLWLSGSLSWPGGADGYKRRVTRVIENWSAYSDSVVGRQEYRYHKTERRLAALTPPDGLRLQHERMLGLVAEAAAVWRDGDATPTAERARRETTTRLAVRELTAEMRAQAPDYAAERDRITESQRQEYEIAAAEFDEVICGAIAKLDGIAPPQALAPQHDALVNGLRALRAAQRELAAARKAFDPDRAAAAGAAWDEATTDIRLQLDRIYGPA